jgi:hypothetical protein
MNESISVSRPHPSFLLIHVTQTTLQPQASAEAEEIDADIRAMTSKRSYSTWTVNRAYTNQQNSSFSNVWNGLIRRNLRASTLWKGFWDLDVLLDYTRKRKRGDHLDPEGPRLLKKIAQGIYRLCYGNCDVWNRAGCFVLGTGQGKSILFIYAAVCAS